MTRMLLRWLIQIFSKLGSISRHSPKEKPDTGFSTSCCVGVLRVSPLRVSCNFTADISVAKPRPQPIKQLLGYSFSAYEQSIVHAFAVLPLADLPPTSVTAIQDLVCLRLVLGGQTATAVKLNRQFPVGTTNEGRRAAQERKQLMLDEAVALMPAAERRLLELELERSGQSGDMSVSGSSSLWNSAVDLSMSMSWEQIGPVEPKANGAPPKSGRTSDTFMRSPATPISKKSGAPRFGGPISALANTAHDSPSFVLGRSPVGPQATSNPPVASTSRVRSLAAKFQNTPPERPGESLYDSVGSANLQRNAFYEPSVSVGSKRPFTQVSPRPLVPSMASSTQPPANLSTASASDVVRELIRDEEDDVEMNASDDGQDVHEQQPEPVPEPEPEPEVQAESALMDKSRQSGMEMDEEEDPRELSFSLFSSISSSRPTKPARSETETKMPPGAFYADDDDDDALEDALPPPPASRPRKPEPPHIEPSISARRRQSRPQNKPPTRSALPRKYVKSQDLGRSLPGSLVDDEDDDNEEHQQEEEEDVVPPLPPISTSTGRSRQPARKSRSSRGDIEKEQEKKEKSARPTRRSSRLSVVSASSRGSSSPEPPASPVKRRSARSSIATPKKKAASKQR